jgi:hypothetical protein
MHFSQIAITSLLASTALAKPLTNVARQEANANLPSVPELGALPTSTPLFPAALARRQEGEGNGNRETGNRAGGPPEGSGNGGGRANDQNVVIGPDGQPVEDGNEGNRNVAPPPPPPQPAAETPSSPPPMQEPPMAPPPVAEPPMAPPSMAEPAPPPATATANPWADQPVVQAPPPMQPPPMGGGAMEVLSADIRNKMMPMVWALGPVTQLKPGLGAMGQVLPKINNVDVKRNGSPST